MTEISVVIVSFNVKNYLLNCIRSVQKASSRFSIEIIVVDNDSSDGSIEAVKKEFPEIITVQNSQNFGFGTACNQGLSIAKGNFLLILNPDTIVEESIFEKLIPSMKSDSEIGMMGCKILNEDGSLQLACRRSFPTPWSAFSRLTGLSKLFPKSPLFASYNLTYLDENKSYQLDAISGSFMLLSRKAYELTQGFDEQFFMYAEDLDLCSRVKESGLKVVYNPEASIIHFKGKSFSKSVDTKFHFYQAMKIFVKKHSSRNTSMLFFLNLAITLRYLIHLLKNYSVSFLSASFDFISLFIAFELVGYFRFGKMFPYPEFVYPQIYIVMAVLQLAVYGWVGVYSSRFGIKRKVILASIIVWSFISLIVYFTRDFAYSRVVVFGSFFAVPMFQIFWRLTAGLFSKEKSSRRGLIVSNDKEFGQSELLKLKYKIINGIEFNSQITTENLNSLDSKSPAISDVLIDADRIDFKTQLLIIQRLKDTSIKCHLISERSLKEVILNDALNQEERTGFLFRLIKKLTDFLLFFEFSGKLELNSSVEKEYNLHYHPLNIFKLSLYYVGISPSKNKRNVEFPAQIGIQSRFHSLNSNEDFILLTLIYNRYHSWQFDRRLIQDCLSEKIKG